MTAWFWQVPVAAVVPAAMYGLCRASDRGYKVERLFKSWMVPVLLIGYIGVIFWRDAGWLYAAMVVAGLACFTIGGALLMRRPRRRS